MSIKFETKASRSMFGKLDGKFVCSIPGTDLITRGDTKEQSEADMILRIAKQSEYGGVHRYMRAKDATFCLFYCGGWEYQIVRDENPSRPSSCMLNCKTLSEAIAAMTSHFNQYQETTK
jgi:hypothetical protein